MRLRMRDLIGTVLAQPPSVLVIHCLLGSEKR
jgi:hypothetical protein